MVDATQVERGGQALGDTLKEEPTQHDLLPVWT